MNFRCRRWRCRMRGSCPSSEVLLQYPAVALFVQRAVAARPDFELNRENAPAVAEICARLDGLPLAIELAAARIKVLSPAAMRTRLASRLQLLTGGARDLPQRQQTLRAAIDWSYDLLSPAEQKLFRRLSVFVGGCTLEGVEAVCDTKGDLDLDLLDGMASMVDKSLVQQVEPANGESRFVMLRNHSRVRSGKTGSKRRGGPDQTRPRRLLPGAGGGRATGRAARKAAEWLERFAVEHDNFRAALEWLTETGDARVGLASRRGPVSLLGDARVSRRRPRQPGQAAQDSPAAAAPTKARARALFAAGVLAGEQGDYAAADALIGESLGIAGQLGDQHGVAVCLNALAVHARDRGDSANARVAVRRKPGLCGENWATRKPWRVLSATWRTSSNCRATMPARALSTRSALPCSRHWAIGRPSPGR